MRYGSVCSGIEAATQAWHPLGWEPAFFSEVDDFPRAVLAHHYPGVPCHGDFTTIKADDYGAIDLLVGGTPCQSFSLAGLRGGLGDGRGVLALEFLRLAARKRARWVVWENVAGALSSEGGRDFAAIIGGLRQLGYGLAWRVLDVQFVRVGRFPRAIPQRRRRVVLVGHIGDWRRAAAVLFDRESLHGVAAPGRGTQQGAAGSAAPGAGVDGLGGVTPMFATGCEGNNGAGIGQAGDPAFTIDTTGTQAVAFNCREDLVHSSEVFGSLGSSSPQSQAVAYDVAQVTSPDNRSNPQPGDPCYTLAKEGKPPVLVQPYVLMSRGRDGGHNLEFHQDGAANTILTPSGGRMGMGVGAIAWNWVVRKLTPRECERLMGFPDDFTLIPWRGKLAPDNRRYKALGNSMGVNMMAWLGERIALVEGLGDVV